MTRHQHISIISALLTIVAIMGCTHRQHTESAVIYDYLETDGFYRADSIINAISDTRDYEYMLQAIDSLNDRGELSKPKYIFYRTITLNLLNQQSTSLRLYYQLDTLDLSELKTQTDIESYVYTYNNYIRMLCDMRRYDRALREANKADKRLRSVGYTTFTEHHDIAQIIGESQLYLDQADSAAINFQRSVDGIHTRLVNHHNPLDLRECQKTMNAIAKAYIRKSRYTDAEPWIKIQDSIYTIADRSPERDTVYLDEMTAEINYSKALLANAEGKKEDAERAYALYQQTNTAKQLDNIINNNDYLMQTGRYAEAARNFERLDEFLLSNAYKCDLENLGRYMLPKYRANLLAGRKDSALHVASLVAEYYNQALVDQKTNDADLLTMVYDTEGKERKIVEQRARLTQQRLLAVAIGGVIILLFFLIYAIMRNRAYKKLNDANKQLIAANERAEESSRMKTKFIQQISHEVRTPLNILSGFSQVLAAPDIEIDSEELQSISKKIVDSSERITQLVDKMLDLSLINGNANIACNDQIGVVDLANQAIKQTGISKASHLDFMLHIDADKKDTTITTNQKQAVKALSLLLDNAQKFTHPLAFRNRRVPEERPSVVLSVDADAQDVSFIVEDTGIGIPFDQAENIFTEFVQLDEYTDGTGIGLPHRSGIGTTHGRRCDTRYHLYQRCPICDETTFIIDSNKKGLKFSPFFYSHSIVPVGFGVRS